MAKYLKPYLAVFQAPFKDRCHYFPGLELVIRWISFAIGSRFLKFPHGRLALDNSLCVFLLVYVCGFKPFRCFTNTVLYASYVVNLECIINLLIYSDTNIGETYYCVMFHALIFVAFAEFGATVLYYLYINHLQKFKHLKSLTAKIKNFWLTHCKFKVKPIPPLNVEPVGEYANLQEELLLVE